MPFPSFFPRPFLNRLITVVLFATVTFPMPSWAAKKNNRGQKSLQLLNKGLYAHRNFNYTRAEAILKQFTSQYPRHAQLDKALIVLTDINLRKKNYPQAKKIIARYNRRFAKSPTRYWMQYYQGLLHIHKRQFQDAALIFVTVINDCQSPLLFRTVNSQLMEIALRKKLSEETLKNIISQLQFNAGLRSQLMVILGDNQVKEKRFSAARKTYKSWLNLYPTHKAASTVKAKLRKIKHKRSPHKAVLIMVPISGAFMDIGKYLLEGILLALELVEKRSGIVLHYKIIDTAGDPLQSVLRLRKFLREEDAAAIIGPAMSDVSLAVAVELSSRNSPIPMITPTATTQGISSLGTGIFQLNVTTAALAERISDYAVKCLKIREFAILAPNTDFGTTQARAFESNVVKLGGDVIATEFYQPEDKDYAGHFQVIRRRKIMKLLEAEWQAAGRNPRQIPDKIVEEYAQDSVLELGGLFIAASNGSEAYKLSSQANYHKLRASIIGSSGWNDPSLLQKDIYRAHGTVFSTNFYLNEKSKQWSKFKEIYTSRWKNKPDKVSLLGYNAVLFLIKGLRTAPQRSLKKNLVKILSFQGIQGEIELHPKEGYNRSAQLLKIGKRAFHPISFCKE